MGHFAPLFVQVGYTFTLLYYLGYLRVTAVSRGEVKIRDVALGQKNWPLRATQVANCFSNQFETPVLFYVLVATIELLHQQSTVFTIGSWLYVGTRLAHGYVEIFGNHVPTRFKIFATGSIILTALWVVLAFKVFGT